jgi:carbon-monoxide dehydrogenase large subunit
MPDPTAASPRLFGARVRRREDPRFLTGRGRYVDDVVLPGMLHAAFVRSPLAHATIMSVDAAQALALDGVHAVVAGRELAGRCKPIAADSGLPGWQDSSQPVLAADRVRFVGEAIAVVVADDRYLAEDALEFVIVEYEPLRPVTTLDEALDPSAPLLHEGWEANRFIRREVSFGDVDAAFASAHGVVEATLSSSRSSGVPLECRGCVAAYDRGQGELTLWTSTQIPHLVRTALADALELPEHRIRVISPDVGGGFGVKSHLYPEEIAISAMAMLTGRPVKWIEDRQEHLLSATQARGHTHDVEVAYSADGEVLGLRARIRVDCGAYSVWPWSAGMDAGMALNVLPGQYRIRNYACEAISVATNKPPIGAYRGVGRPGATLSLERALDEVARRLDLDPLEIRRRNYVRSEDFPYESVTGLVYDSGSYLEALEAVAEAAGYDALRKLQVDARRERRYLGIGFASYTEQTGHGSRELAKSRRAVVPGFDAAFVRMDPSGGVTVQVSTHSHGQSHETTLAQVVADELGLELDDVRIRFGDTASSPYGHGTFSSRSAVLGASAAQEAALQVADRLREFAGHHLEVHPADLDLRDGHVVVRGSPASRVAVRDLARWTYHRPEKLPDGMQAVLEGTSAYDPQPGTGNWANGAHLVLVEVDPETGAVEILGYWVGEDCGRMINPLVVDGQVHGGVVQGIGGALLEQFAYDATGQPTATTFKDYRLVGPTDVPRIEIAHLETPSPNTPLGTKGVGEGGTIAPGAAISAAVSDALSPLGAVFVDALPVTPERVRAYVARARAAAI